MPELNTLAPKKWSWTGGSPGSVPTLDITDDIKIGDFAIDTRVTPANVWLNIQNTAGDPVWVEPSGENLQNEVYVAKNGDDTNGDGTLSKPYLTVKQALASITGNSPINRYTIKVGPGVYIEDNPLQMKAWVAIEGQAQPSTAINALNGTSNLFIASSSPVCSLVSLGLGGVTSGYCVEVTSPTSIVMQNIVIQESDKGILVNNASSQVTIDDLQLRSDSGTMTKGIEVLDGFVTMTNLRVRGQATITDIIDVNGSDALFSLDMFYTNSNNITNAVWARGGADVTIFNGRITGDLGDRMGVALRCEGTGSELDVLSTYIQHADYGLYVDGDCEVSFAGLAIENCDYGVYTHTTGNETIDINGGAIKNSISWDIYVTESSAKVIGSGLRVDENKLFLDSASIYMAHVSENEGDEGLNIKGELHVGSPESPSESVFGAGDSYTRGMLVYTYNNNTSTYTDVSVEARSASGSTFTFTSTNENDAIYVASDLINNGDYLIHLGIKSSTETAANVGSGSIVAEYWDGNVWSETTTMSTDSGEPYYSNSNELFAHSGSHQIRFDNNLSSTAWQKNDPPSTGTNRYWLRYRIVDGITTAPVFQQYKLHTNRAELNADGYMEYFADARPVESLPWDLALIRPAGSSPGNQDLYLSKNIVIGREYNLMGDDDKVGFMRTLPQSCDTSTPILFKFSCVPSSTDTINWKIYWGYTKANDNIYFDSSSAPSVAISEQSTIFSGVATVGEENWFEVELDISNMNATPSSGLPDDLWINIQKISGGGAVALVDIDATYTKWNNGGSGA